jgi:GxxExxY protein
MPVLRTSAEWTGVPAAGPIANRIQIGAACGYRIDVVVEQRVILELKTVDRLMPIHEAQMLTYLKLSGLHTGLLLNFNSAVLKDGMRRMML